MLSVIAIPNGKTMPESECLQCIAWSLFAEHYQPGAVR